MKLYNKKGASLCNRVQQKKGARLGKFGAKLGNRGSLIPDPDYPMIFDDNENGRAENCPLSKREILG